MEITEYTTYEELFDEYVPQHIKELSPLDRLKYLYQFLILLPDYKFDYNHVITDCDEPEDHPSEHACGTAGCVAGWAALTMASFPRGRFILPSRNYFEGQLIYRAEDKVNLTEFLSTFFDVPYALLHGLFYGKEYTEFVDNTKYERILNEIDLDTATRKIALNRLAKVIKYKEQQIENERHNEDSESPPSSEEST